MKTVFAFSIFIVAAQAQYPGGYPGGIPGAAIPAVIRDTPAAVAASPCRGAGKQQPDSTKGQPLPNFRGKLKQMDAKSITLELDDNRVLDFKRTDKTKFFKGGEELKTPEFAAGDQVSVEGPADRQAT